MFAGPHKLIQKRFDKLLDYDNCKERADRFKDRRVQDELQVARNNYEALNAQLLDELPKFHSAAEELFTGCVRAFAQAQKDFMKSTLGELKPLLQAVSVVCSDFKKSDILFHEYLWKNAHLEMHNFVTININLFQYLNFQFSNRVGTESNLIAQFQEEHSRVLQLLQSFSFCPENLPPPTSTKKPFEKKTLEKQTNKKTVQGPVSLTLPSFLPYHI